MLQLSMVLFPQLSRIGSFPISQVHHLYSCKRLAEFLYSLQAVRYLPQPSSSSIAAALIAAETVSVASSISITSYPSLMPSIEVPLTHALVMSPVTISVSMPCRVNSEFNVVNWWY